MTLNILVNHNIEMIMMIHVVMINGDGDDDGKEGDDVNDVI